MQANYPPPHCSHFDMSKCLHACVYTCVCEGERVVCVCEGGGGGAEVGRENRGDKLKISKPELKSDTLLRRRKSLFLGIFSAVAFTRFVGLFTGIRNVSRG